MSSVRILCRTFVFSLAILLTAAVFTACGKRGGSKDVSAGKGHAGEKEVPVDISGFPDEATVKLPDGVTMTLIKVEAGTFAMSSEDGENEYDEVLHSATLTKDFYIGKTEVTQAQWRAVMG